MSVKLSRKKSRKYRDIEAELGQIISDSDQEYNHHLNQGISIKKYATKKRDKILNIINNERDNIVSIKKILKQQQITKGNDIETFMDECRNNLNEIEILTKNNLNKYIKNKLIELKLKSNKLNDFENEININGVNHDISQEFEHFMNNNKITGVNIYVIKNYNIFKSDVVIDVTDNKKTITRDTANVSLNDVNSNKYKRKYQNAREKAKKNKERVNECERKMDEQTAEIQKLKNKIASLQKELQRMKDNSELPSSSSSSDDMYDNNNDNNNNNNNSNPAYWKCKSCTYHNQLSLNRCQMCSAKK